MNADTVEEKSEADQQMDSALSGLKVVVENYPELKAILLMGLMDELSGSENRISVARKDYNEAVKAYNTRLVKFPGMYLVPCLALRRRHILRPMIQQQIRRM